MSQAPNRCRPTARPATPAATLSTLPTAAPSATRPIADAPKRPLNRPLSRPLNRPLNRRLSRPTLAAAALLAALAVPGAAWAQAAAPAAAASAPRNTLRAEVGKPLVAAQQALQAGNPQDALARVAEAEAVKEPTAWERYMISRVKGAALVGAGDTAAALAVFEGVSTSPELPAAERPLILETATKLAIQAKDYPRAAALMKRYQDAGGANPELRRLYPQLLQLAGDHAGVVREVGALVATEEAAGRLPREDALRLMAASQNQLGDAAGYRGTLEKLAATTGKPEYWGEVLQRAQRGDAGGTERLRLDWYRLGRAAGLNLSANEWADLTVRAMQAGLPAEAQAAADQGFALNLMGQGANAAEDRKLREQVTKLAAQDRAGQADSEASARKAATGDPLVTMGLALSGAGQHAQGLALMQAGFAKGGLRRPDEARLHLAVVQSRAGQNAEALKTLAEVRGADGTAELARLWTLLLNAPVKPGAAARGS